QRRHGGFLNKVEFADRGCTLLLFWGAPTTREGELGRALQFLLDLRERTEVEFRAGVTYRHVYAGFIGSPGRAEYTCYGDGVNLAARLMAAAAPGEIWVGPGVAQRMPGEFVLADRGEHALKGFG